MHIKFVRIDELYRTKGIVMEKITKLFVPLFMGIISLVSFANQIPLSPYSTNRLIVKLKKGETLSHFENVSRTQHLFEGVYVLYSKNINELEKELKAENIFEYIEHDYYHDTIKLEQPTNITKMLGEKKASNTQFNDPGIAKQWSFLDESQYGISVTKAYASRDAGEPQANIIVAVVDTGVDYNHQDLKNIMWTNEKEIAGNGIDDDGNGYIDDIHGINTLVRDNQGRATMNVMDGHSHGSHVSGIIAAEQNNGIGIAGVASHTKIMAIRTVPNDADELDVDVVEAFIYAAKNGAKIINCSFGKSVNEGGNAVHDAIDYIGKNYGVLVVVAAGNDTQNIDTILTYPASYDNDNLMVVASTQRRGGLSFFSNYGAKNVDLASPGSDIFSTIPNNSYANMSGTSMATPNAVGVAAEVLSHHPELGPVELKNHLMATVGPVPTFAGKMVAAGRIDLAKALK